MTTKSERRERKRRQREKSRRMRGDRSVFVILREKLKRNRYYEACTLDVDVLTVNTDDWWHQYSSVSAILLDTPRGISAEDINRKIAKDKR